MFQVGEWDPLHHSYSFWVNFILCFCNWGGCFESARTGWNATNVSHFKFFTSCCGVLCKDFSQFSHVRFCTFSRWVKEIFFIAVVVFEWISWYVFESDMFFKSVWTRWNATVWLFHRLFLNAVQRLQPTFTCEILHTFHVGECNLLHYNYSFWVKCLTCFWVFVNLLESWRCMEMAECT